MDRFSGMKNIFIYSLETFFWKKLSRVNFITDATWHKSWKMDPAQTTNSFIFKNRWLLLYFKIAINIKKRAKFLFLKVNH